MSDKVWHYTVGDDQFGPITSDELKKLAEAGTVSLNDQVWKEGMSDWMSASEMKGLFPNHASGAPAIKEMEIGSPPQPHGKRKLNMPKSIDPLAYLQPYGHAVLLVGFLLVVFARGCDSVGNRYVARADAKKTVAKLDFEYEEKQIQDELDEATEKDKQDRYQKALKELKKDYNKDSLTLEAEAKAAAANNAKNGYWREMLFVLGTMAFVIGLITVGFRGEGSEKTICLVMLAIVTVSLYVVGTPWIGSLPGLLGR